LSTARGSCQSVDHFSTLSIKSLKSLTKVSDETCIYDLASSAKNLEIEYGGKQVSKSLIKSRKRMGPSTLPCGTPLKTGLRLEREDPTLTRWDLSVRKEAIVDNILPEIPISFNLYINLGTETQSNALAKSTYKIRVLTDLSKLADQSLTDSKRLVHVE
jgi:hypothetical protein